MKMHYSGQGLTEEARVRSPWWQKFVEIHQAPVVQRLDNFIHWVNRSPVNKMYYCTTYTFEQLDG